MRKKFKYLLTGLCLGLTATTIGGIAVSCAAANTNNDPNPASANSIKTNSGDPLTQEQSDYHKKLAAEIQVEFDANEKLDYSKPEDKEIIDAQLTNYEKELNVDKLGKYFQQKKNFLKKYKEPSLEAINESNQIDISFYNNFRQKNILPTEKEANKILERFKADNSDSEFLSKMAWQSFIINFAIFYTNPKIFIIGSQIELKNEKHKNDNPNDLSVWDFLGHIVTINLFSVYLENNFPAYEILTIYKDLLKNLDNAYQDVVDKFIIDHSPLSNYIC